MNIHCYKKLLRHQITQKLIQFDQKAAVYEASLIVEHFKTWPIWINAGCVGMFAPLKLEVDIWPLIRLGIESGKNVYMPSYLENQDEYCFRRLFAIEELQKGRFGIFEPPPTSPRPENNVLDLIIIPGLAFDFYGGRLGRGKGYYDRLLAQYRGIKCGVAYTCQLVAEIPMDTQDVKMDWLVTPLGIYRVAR